MRAALLVGCALAVVSSGCARNAVFELELELPAQPPGPNYYAVASASTEGFGVGGSAAPVSLRPNCERAEPPPDCLDRTLDPACSVIVSVVAEERDLEDPLFVRVRFCRNPGCDAPEDASAPEHRILVERAFYRGQFTQGRACIDALPTEPSPTPERIDRCAVRCREGVVRDQCYEDGTHFCE